ncbi:MAG: ribonuclease [Sphingomonadales bacterium]|nr:ribonuclease [Sphingomonadales bacterium]MDE2168644.1 ribonuclease [Sphingomonadales bacterium]
MEWLVEEGIGEHRALGYRAGEVVAARVDWTGTLAAGLIEEARLTLRLTGTRRGIARFANGEEVLVDNLPRDASEGALLRLAITRAALAEKGRFKQARARPTTAEPRPAPTLVEALREQGHDARLVRRLPSADWNEVWQAAWHGEMAFAGGALIVSPTPAMTLIDIDGPLSPRDLALASVDPVARAIGWLDLAGSIGIDFPTLSARGDRQAVDHALDAALDDWPHERTAMNGFGFVQIVARMERPSLLARFAQARAGAAARLLLRHAEGVDAPGALLLTCAPAVQAAVSEDWLAQLARRTGRPIRWQIDPALALESGFAQAVPS